MMRTAHQGEDTPDRGSTVSNAEEEDEGIFGIGLDLLVVLLDSFFGLVVLLLMLASISRIVDFTELGRMREIQKENERLRMETKLQLQRISMLENRLQDPELEGPGDGGETSTILVTRGGGIHFTPKRASEPVRVASLRRFENWLKTHSLAPAAQVAGEQGADYELVIRIAEVIRTHRPNTRIYFVAGVRSDAR